MTDWVVVTKFHQDSNCRIMLQRGIIFLSFAIIAEIYLDLHGSLQVFWHDANLYSIFHLAFFKNTKNVFYILRIFTFDTKHHDKSCFLIFTVFKIWATGKVVIVLKILWRINTLHDSHCKTNKELLIFKHLPKNFCATFQCPIWRLDAILFIS